MREAEGEGEGQYRRHLSYYPEVDEGGGCKGRKTNDPNQIEGNTYSRNRQVM